MNDCGGNSRGGGGGRKVLGGVALIVLAEDEVFLAHTLAADGWDEYVLTGSDFESSGPGIEDLVIHAEGSNFSTHFEYDVILQYKYKNGDWKPTTALVLVGPNSTGDYTPSAPFTDRSKLGIRIRLVLRTRIKAGATVPQKGTMNISVAVRRFPS